MNRRTLLLLSWLLAVVFTTPYQPLPNRFTLASEQARNVNTWLRGTASWLIAAGLSAAMLKRRLFRGTDLIRSAWAGGCIGLLAVALFALDLGLEVPPGDRGVYVNVVIASAIAAAFAGFAASYWQLGKTADRRPG